MDDETSGAGDGSFVKRLNAQLQELQQVLLAEHLGEVDRLAKQLARLEEENHRLRDNLVVEDVDAAHKVSDEGGQASEVQAPNSQPAMLNFAASSSRTPVPFAVTPVPMASTPVPAASQAATSQAAAPAATQSFQLPTMTKDGDVRMVYDSQDASDQDEDESDESSEEDDMPIKEKQGHKARGRSRSLVVSRPRSKSMDASALARKRGSRGDELHNDSAARVTLCVTPTRSGDSPNASALTNAISPLGLLSVPGMDGSSSSSAKKESKNSRRDSTLSVDSRASASRKASVASNASFASSAASVMVFEVLPQWRKDRKTNDARRSSFRGVSGLPTTPTKDDDDGIGPRDASASGRLSTISGAPQLNKLKGRKRFYQRAIVPPSSLRHLVWEFMGLVLIMYDAAVIPLDWLDPPDNTATIAFGWAVRLFWTLDLCESATTGYLLPQGTVEMRLHKIALHYVTTWLPFDLLCVSCDWGALIAGDGVGPIVRLLRLVRMARLAKSPVVAHIVTEHLRSEFLILFASMFKVIVLLLACAHIIACAWYGIGTIGHARGRLGNFRAASEDPGWVLHLGVENSPLHDRYTRSLHWSLAHFAGEPMVIEPQTTIERSFAVLVLFFTFIFSTLFVSSITTSMTRLMIVAGKEGRDVALLRRFLSDRNVTSSLSVRMQRNAQHALAELKRNAPEESVELLKLVSEPLRVELHYEMYSPFLLEHPFLYCYNEVNPASTRKVCHFAVNFATVSQGDIIFSDCESPEMPVMYFIEKGRVKYQQNLFIGNINAIAGTESFLSADTDDGSPICILEAGQWACEGVLWTTWMTYGTMIAKEECRLIQLDAEKFRAIVAPFPTSHPNRYAVAFVDLLNKMKREEISDLWNPGFTKAVAAAFPDRFEQPLPVPEESARASSKEAAKDQRRLFPIVSKTSSSSPNVTPSTTGHSDRSDSQPVMKKKMSRTRSGLVGGPIANVSWWERLERRVWGSRRASGRSLLSRSNSSVSHRTSVGRSDTASSGIGVLSEYSLSKSESLAASTSGAKNDAWA